MRTRWFAILLLLFAPSVWAQSMNKAKTECEKLMNALLPFAQQTLERHGEFFPYGGAMKGSGEIANLAGYDGRENPPSADIIRLLKQGFVQGAKSG